MIKRFLNFIKNHPLMILLWISIASLSGLVTWVTLMGEETKTYRLPPSCTIPMPEVELEVIHAAERQELQLGNGNSQAIEHEKKEENLSKEPPCWKIHSLDFNPPQNAKVLSLVVSGLGLNQDLTIQAIKELPPYITFSFSPYTYNLQEWIQKAKEAQHEVLIDMPFNLVEGVSCDGGLLALDCQFSTEDNLKKLEELIQRAKSFVGFNAVDALSMEFSFWQPILKVLDEKGITFLGPEDLSQDDNKLLLHPVRLDQEMSHEAIKEKLSLLEKKAFKEKKVIAIAQVTPLFIEIVNEWVSDIGNKEIILGPLSGILNINGQ